jgi:hypothetical protein
VDGRVNGFLIIAAVLSAFEEILERLPKYISK